MPNFAELKAVNLMEMVKSVLVNQLGTYIYPSGYTCPSVSVDNPENNIKIQGVEAIIPLSASAYESRWLSGKKVFRKEKWQIILVDHPYGDNYESKLISANDRLSRFLPNSTSIYVPANSIYKSLPQCVIKFCYEDVQSAINQVWV